jgi:hypothetical protein
MKPSIKKILWGAVIVVVIFGAIQAIQLFFINGRIWRVRGAMEESLNDSGSYSPALRAEILQTEGYKKFKQTSARDSLFFYFKQATDEGRVRMKNKDSTP